MSPTVSLSPFSRNGLRLHSLYCQQCFTAELNLSFASTKFPPNFCPGNSNFERFGQSVGRLCFKLSNFTFSENVEIFRKSKICFGRNVIKLFPLFLLGKNMGLFGRVVTPLAIIIGEFGSLNPIIGIFWIQTH